MVKIGSVNSGLYCFSLEPIPKSNRNIDCYITAKVWPASRKWRIKRLIAPYSIFQMDYGMKLGSFCPERNRLKQQADQLYPIGKVIDGVYTS